MRLDHKTVLVTGANRGIGQAIVKELSSYPTHLLVGMRDTSTYKSPTNTKALSITPVKLDLSSKSSIEACVKALPNRGRDIDVLINNAGQFIAGPLQAQDMDKMYAMFQTNIVGLAHLTHKLLPYLLKRQEAKIVNNASIAGYAYFPKNTTYSATKAGVIAFSEALRRELEQTHVSVLQIVTPGVDTDMFRDVEAAYAQGDKPPRFAKTTADEWAKKIIAAIEADKAVLAPNGSTGLLKLVSRGPLWLMDIISRRIV